MPRWDSVQEMKASPAQLVQAQAAVGLNLTEVHGWVDSTQLNTRPPGQITDPNGPSMVGGWSASYPT
jgi:hypothetical protein